MEHCPRVLAIHDLSGVGKCSLTVALPILSVMGAEVAVMPTAVLSTHTGGITGYTCLDMTEQMLPTAKHWRSLGLTFDAIYSGWLGSIRQNQIVSDILAMFSAEGTLRLIDPVMGDHGRLYSTFTAERVQGLLSLCQKADVITPNLTEACFLLGEPYKGEILSPDEVRNLCKRLARLGPSHVVITGISTAESTLGAAALDARTDNFSLHEMPRIPGLWHGTGDIFSSTVLGALLGGQTLSGAVALAVRFTYDCINRTHMAGLDPRFGVRFEAGLPALAAICTKEETECKAQSLCSSP